MLRATPLGLYMGESIILPIWNPYGVMREKSLRFNSRCLTKGLVFKKRIRDTAFTGIADYIGTPFHV